MDAYYTVAEIETACLNLAAQYPTLARSITLPELTPEGRTSRALHISTSGWNSGAPALMVVAGLQIAGWLGEMSFSRWFGPTSRSHPAGQSETGDSP